MNKIAVTLLVGVACVALPLSAQSFSRNPHPPDKSVGQVPLARAPLAQQTITQSTATTITTGNSVSCNAGGLHTDNSYYRGMTLSTFPALTLPQFMVQQVTIGVEQATAASGTQPMTVNIWSATANPIAGAANPPGNNQISTQAATVADQSLTLLPVTLTTQPVMTVATGILAVEVFTPNGQASNSGFFIGSNAAGQSGPSYIKAADCSVTSITDTAGIGFPNMHIVMSVLGNNQTPVELQSFDVQ